MGLGVSGRSFCQVGWDGKGKGWEVDPSPECFEGMWLAVSAAAVGAAASSAAMEASATTASGCAVVRSGSGAAVEAA